MKLPVSMFLPLLVGFLALPVVNPILRPSVDTGADSGSDGSSMTVDKTINDSNRITLVSVTATLDNSHSHRCVIVGSAGTSIGSNGVLGFFELLDGAQVISPALRQLYFGGSSNLPVSTNITLGGLQGTHTFNFTARKYPSSPDFVVTESAISVTCQQGTAI
jgi:hypothetical protein